MGEPLDKSASGLRASELCSQYAARTKGRKVAHQSSVRADGRTQKRGAWWDEHDPSRLAALRTTPAAPCCLSHGVAPNRLSRHRDRLELQVQGRAQFLGKIPGGIDIVDHDFDVGRPRAPQELHDPAVV